MDLDSDATKESVGKNCKTEAVKRLPGDCECKSEELEGPPDGFLYVLPFLDLQSRLTVERVSKSLLEAVRDNPLVWQHLHVEWPASRMLTDDILLRLVKRADGHVNSLSVTDSLRISETALEQVLTLNPGLEELSVPGCTGLSAETIVRLVESHSLKGWAKGLSGIKQVRIRGLYNITKEQLDRLQGVLFSSHRQHDPAMQVSIPRYLGNVAAGIARHDTQPIDVEVCPFCENIRVVYDCTKHRLSYDLDRPCRGCTFCIPRCEECGCCIKDLSYEESLCGPLVCIDCWLSLPKCSECNRALCSRHAHQFVQSAGTSFTCEGCLAEKDGLDFSFPGEI